MASRPLVFVLGPPGSGKTRVAEKVVSLPLPGTQVPPRPMWLSACAFHDVLTRRVSDGAWRADVENAPQLVLDGLCFLRERQGVVVLLGGLLRSRIQAGLRTVLVQGDASGSVDVLMAEVDSGVHATVGLRFPVGERGRLRFARRVCDHLGIPRIAARGTEMVEPWTYLGVIRALSAGAAPRPRPRPWDVGERVFVGGGAAPP